MKNVKALLALLLPPILLCGCGNSEGQSERKAVRVKVQCVGTVQVNGERGYSGTVMEESGASLSFSTTGTVRTLSVSEGQMVRRGQLIATLDGADQSGDLQGNVVRMKNLAEVRPEYPDLDSYVTVNGMKATAFRMARDGCLLANLPSLAM